MPFESLGLSSEIRRAVSDSGYDKPTPIQEKAIPYVLMGRDVLGVAQTGTGKTASFTLPMIDILSSGRGRARMPRSLILEPTRELAAQVAENFEKYGKYTNLSMALLIGGESMKDQQAALMKGVDVLIATPGRLLDLFDRGQILLADTKLLVIDEADRMLDMGFIPDVERIVSLLPKIRQTLFFSATMAPEIKRLADAFLMNPKEVKVSRPAATADTVVQKFVRTGSEAKAKRAALRSVMTLEAEDMKSALVFCNRKRDVGIVARSLKRHNYNVEPLHGDMVQSARMDALNRFKEGEVQILVCSDVAARGLDIPDVSHVFNYDVSHNAEDYVHRIGRTGRAGRSGRAFTFVSPVDKKSLAAVQKLIGKAIDEFKLDDQVSKDEAPQKEAAPETQNQEEETRSDATDEKSERKARRPRRRKSSADKKAQEQAAAESQETQEGNNDVIAETAETEVRKTKGERRRRRETPQEKAANNNSPFGEHTPAFMLRPVPIAANG
ncbi:DEAD/DEAH box helicase [Rhodovibrionaceae bacterium A322]